MASQDFLFYSVGLGFLILIGFLSYAAYCLAKSLETLTMILQDAQDISSDIDKLEHRVKFGLLNLLHIFSKKEGGEKMTNKKGEKGMNPLAAGAIGAAVGAAIGVAAVELSDEKNREKIGEKLGELGKEGEKIYAQINESTTEARDKVEDAKNVTEKKIKKLAAHK